MKKKFFITLLVLITVVSGVFAQKTGTESGHLALGLEASTTGFGVELAARLNNHFALRGGVSYLPPYSRDTTFKVNLAENVKNEINDAINSDPRIPLALGQLGLPTRAEDINTDILTTATLKLINWKILIDYYPWAKYGFHFTGGVYIGKSNLVKINGSMNQADEILGAMKTFGVDFSDVPVIIEPNYQLTGKDLAKMEGSINATSVKPYLGIGFGRAIPKSRVGISLDLGAFYQGKPELVSDNDNVRKFMDSELKDVSEALKKLPFYPVLSLKVNVKIF